ncbi:TPA: hypothetical protein ACGO7C_001349 [Streptococcus suis]
MEISVSESKYSLKRKNFSINNLKLFESYQLVENETRINKFRQLFKNRRSYRGDLLSINKETWMEILEDLRNDSNIHPVPSCGNFNFIKVIVIDEKEDIVLFDLNKGFSTFDNDAANLLRRIQNKNLSRSDIRGKGGTYYIFLLNMEIVKLKYGTMADALSFVTLGCYIQTILLNLSIKSIYNCIHFGMLESFSISVEDGTYESVCMIRMGEKDDKNKFINW